MIINDFEKAMPEGIEIDHIYLGTIDGHRNQVKLCKAHHRVKNDQYVFNARGECFVLSDGVDFEDEMRFIASSDNRFFYFVTNSHRAHRDATLDLKLPL
jgi:hypothetical protein